MARRSRSFVTFSAISGSSWSARFSPRSQAPLGNALPEALRRAPSTPIRDHLNQPRPPGIVPGTRMSPVQRIVNIPAHHGVVVNVLDLLPHHVVVPNLLRMTSFLPNLVG